MISGEEEAIYGWTAVNFVKGTLIQNSQGSGSVRRANLTYGVLEMGGASTQIGFFEPEGDVMANLFKLQVGAAKHWNVYVHSFLYFGVNGAFDRLNAGLYTEASQSNSTESTIYNPCLPGGGNYVFTSRVHMLNDGTMLPLSSPDDPKVLEASLYTALMRNPNPVGDFDQCMLRVKDLLRTDANSWCNFAHDRDCSFAGIYQVRMTALNFLLLMTRFFIKSPPCSLCSFLFSLHSPSNVTISESSSRPPTFTMSLTSSSFPRGLRWPKSKRLRVAFAPSAWGS